MLIKVLVSDIGSYDREKSVEWNITTEQFTEICYVFVSIEEMQHFSHYEKSLHLYQYIFGLIFELIFTAINQSINKCFIRQKDRNAEPRLQQFGHPYKKDNIENWPYQLNKQLYNTIYVLPSAVTNPIQTGHKNATLCVIYSSVSGSSSVLQWYW